MKREVPALRGARLALIAEKLEEVLLLLPGLGVPLLKEPFPGMTQANAYLEPINSTTKHTCCSVSHVRRLPPLVPQLQGGRRARGRPSSVSVAPCAPARHAAGAGHRRPRHRRRVVRARGEGRPPAAGAPFTIQPECLTNSVVCRVAREATVAHLPQATRSAFVPDSFCRLPCYAFYVHRPAWTKCHSTWVPLALPYAECSCFVRAVEALGAACNRSYFDAAQSLCRSSRRCSAC
jgi:hypothetical protein